MFTETFQKRMNSLDRATNMQKDSSWLTYASDLLGSYMYMKSVHQLRSFQTLNV